MDNTYFQIRSINKGNMENAVWKYTVEIAVHST